MLDFYIDSDTSKKEKNSTDMLSSDAISAKQGENDMPNIDKPKSISYDISPNEETSLDSSEAVMGPPHDELDKVDNMHPIEKKSILSIQGINKYFGKKRVVSDVSFSMTQGEIVGLLGPNVAGKTTSFYMILGFYKPNAGDVFLDGIPITDMPIYERAQLGISYLPQEASVFRKLTVEQNIYSILETRRELSKSQRQERLEQLLEEFRITRMRKQPAYSLSGGERRRTEIARALAIEPKFLLLDEPFAGIDPIAIHDIKEIIMHLAKRNIGVLITDHNVRDTLEITEHAYIINNGVIVESGNRQKIINSDIARRIYLGETFKL